MHAMEQVLERVSNDKWLRVEISDEQEPISPWVQG